MHPVDSPIGIYGQLFPTSLRLLCPSPFSPCYSPILNVIPFSRFLSARRDAFSTLPLCWCEILFHSASFFIVMPVIWFRFAMTPSSDHFHSLFLRISWLSSFFLWKLVYVIIISVLCYPFQVHQVLKYCWIYLDERYWLASVIAAAKYFLADAQKKVRGISMNCPVPRTIQETLQNYFCTIYKKAENTRQM